MSLETPQQGPTQEDLENALKIELRKQQDVVYAIIGGLAAALVGAIIWAAITVSTGYQIGYMAVAVGLLVGVAVRYFGHGIDFIFGVIGGLMALFGCALGNLLSQLAFAAQQESIGYFDALGFLNFEVAKQLFQGGASPMDLVFYGIAIYEGYRFALRNLEAELAIAVSQGKVTPMPYASLRLPVVIGLFVVISGIAFFSMRSSTGVQTYTYESGAKRSVGEIVSGKENGPWELWWENGNLQGKGFFVNGNYDSTWSYYNEDGVLTSTGKYRKGLQQGEWITYHSEGIIAAKGNYERGRQTGPWVFNYQNGNVSAKGSMVLDLRDGEWEEYYENGQVSSKGSYVNGEPVGFWTEWTEDGRKSKESEYDGAGNEKLLNVWDLDGKQTIVNGTGEIARYDGEQLITRGLVKNGWSYGKIETFYANGQKWEVGEYRDNVYYMQDAWSDKGDKLVTNGTGDVELFYPNGMKSAFGKMNGGLKMGLWTFNYPTHEQAAFEENYSKGKREGDYTGYSEDGVVTLKGKFVDDKRHGEWTWYQSDGMVESVVTYINGKKEGNQLFFGSYGDLLKTEVYKDGKLVETIL